MRKLVSVKQITDIRPIPNADAIEAVHLGGWIVVGQKDLYKVGQYVFYCEIDSVLPVKPEFEWLRPRCYVKNDLVEGFRIRTIKLRGQISQGLMMPMEELGYTVKPSFFDPNLNMVNYEEKHKFSFPVTSEFSLDHDFTEEFGVVKYEAPIPTCLAGRVVGLFPSRIRKSDQERAQNLVHEIFTENKDTRYEVTVMLDGTSTTAFNMDDATGVCSRNLNLMVDDESVKENSLVRLFVESGLQKFLESIPEYSIQGELMGPGIQKNREKLPKVKFYVYNTQNLKNYGFDAPDTRKKIVEQAKDCGVEIDHVPILHNGVTLADLSINTIEDLIAFADGPSLNSTVREGLVFKSVDSDFQFKIISNTFLIKNEE